MDYELKSARYLAHAVWVQAVNQGDIVIDATMGNGHDTLILAHLVGELGRVIAMDVQQDALNVTHERLKEAGVLDRCALYLIGHERMNEVASAPVALVAFNLGWLPGGDKSITTRLETTLLAVSHGLALLKKGGVMTVCIYPGHDEGDREREALLEYFQSLRPQAFNCLHQRFLNAGDGAPECIIIQKQ